MLFLDYEHWSRRYASVFGLTSAADQDRFAEWYEIFDSCGYSLDELDGATMDIGRQPPEFPNQHLGRIHASITAGRRAKAIARARGAEVGGGGPGVCAVCGDSGWVTVPHPRLVIGGDWLAAEFGGRLTAAVCCGCWKGRSNETSWESLPDKEQLRIPRPLTLDAYRRSNPGWAEQMARDQAERLAVLGFQADADPQRRAGFDEVRNRLAAAFGLPQRQPAPRKRMEISPEPPAEKAVQELVPF